MEKLAYNAALVVGGMADITPLDPGRNMTDFKTRRSSKTDRIPLHRRIRDELRREIVQGRAPYSELPAEQEIARRFNTTRMTVRQAIAALELEGLVEKQQGRRTLVCPPKETQPIFVLPHDNPPYDQNVQSITHTLLHQKSITPPAPVREKLKLSWQAKSVIYISRLRLLHGEPLSMYQTYFPLGRADGLLKEDLTGRSLVSVARNGYGITPAKMSHTFEVLLADEEDSKLLKVRERSPILLIESVEFDERDAPISYNIEKCRADRYRFQLTISSPDVKPLRKKK
ncbi:MAG: UTRA domain-containing protein [bacterium]|nr:UTRA domain-containing protein [bacterium]